MSGLQVLAILAILGSIIGFGVAGVFWLMPSRRPRAKYVQGASVAALIIGIIGFNVAGSKHASDAGFRSMDDQKAAAAEGITEGAQWYQLLDARKAESERQAQEKAAADRAACRADFTCWGRENADLATRHCKRAIEQQARYAHDWTDTWTEPAFIRFAWADEAAGVMTYFGDRLKLQNGFGAWVNVSYACDYDTEKSVALKALIIEP